MTPQGYPLWAVNDQMPSVTWAVIGWIERTPNTALPVVVPVAGGVPVAWSGADGEAVRWTFTTADPSAPSGRNAVAKLRDLRDRLAALADEMEGLGIPQSAAAVAIAIRQELAK